MKKGYILYVTAENEEGKKDSWTVQKGGFDSEEHILNCYFESDCYKSIKTAENAAKKYIEKNNNPVWPITSIEVIEVDTQPDIGSCQVSRYTEKAQDIAYKSEMLRYNILTLINELKNDKRFNEDFFESLEDSAFDMYHGAKAVCEYLETMEAIISK